MSFETEYGTIHLTKERYQEYIDIVNKHTTAMLLELKEHEIVPICLSLAKTSVYELQAISDN